MTEFESLTYEAEKDGLTVVEVPFQCFDGLIKGRKIGIRSSIETYAQKADVLAEELGHAKLNVGNILDLSELSNRKQEYIARMWAYDKRIGLDGIIKAYKCGCCSLRECAECLDTSEEFLEEALEMYRRKYGCSVEYEGYEIHFEPRLVVYELEKN